LRKATVSFVMSVCLSVRLSALKTSSPNGQNFMKFDIQYISKISREIQVRLKSDKCAGILHEDQYTFFIISGSFLLVLRNV